MEAFREGISRTAEDVAEEPEALPDVSEIDAETARELLTTSPTGRPRHHESDGVLRPE
ncbi:hypothetical protein [Nesterenkonia cremea]|uniref:Uncharacterized protein n=1 Tax=Nesterenkonia cremea TaxID=1882340 RepID=A0A917ENL5_9MICC|nr:hypothetical protein [Nesterenkonia cremea]GGE63286.1 hypothetical protein GCM10011401_08010 [Nesterenkonia cremea]